jgi:glutamate synthase (NADPH/NADH) small chain
MVAGRTHIPVVDGARCNACGACIHACPAWVLGPLRGEGDSLRGAVAQRILFPDPGPGGKFFEVPPCTAACPLGQDVPGYLGAIARGDAAAALEIILRTNPLPSVLGRVCMRPCEKACARGKIEESPDIRGMKRFAASAGVPAGRGRRARSSGAGRVAVIGSGPAGLAAAGVLLRGGADVVIFERSGEAGGMLRYGLGEFDLPLEDLGRDIDRILAEGAVIETGVEITSLHDVERDARAVIIATGAGGSSALFKHSMEKIGGAREAASFMAAVRSGKIKTLEGNVVVEGFAPWALTAARAAVRLGASSVALVSPFEVSGDAFEAALGEGIEVIQPARVAGFTVRSGKLAGLECVRLEFEKRDIRGRALHERVKGAFTRRAETFISAMDREPDCAWVHGEEGIARGIGGTLLVDPVTLETGRGKIFAAGDVVTGPRSVISAVAMGVKAARAVLKML